MLNGSILKRFWLHYACRWQQRCLCPFSAIQSNEFKTLNENQKVEFGVEQGP